MKKIALSAASLVALTTSVLAADLPSRKEPVIAPPPPPMWTGFYAGLNAGYNFGTNGNVMSQNWGTNATGLGGIVDGTFVTSTAIANSGPFAMNSNVSNNQSGFIGGAQFGYNYQWGNFVIGVETDIQGTSTRGTSTSRGLSSLSSPSPEVFSDVPAYQNNTSIGSTVVNSGVDYLGTIRGRLGYLATPSLLVYGTGGFTYGGVYANVTQSAFQANTFVTRNYSDDLDATSWIGGGQQSQLLTGWNAGGGVEWMFMPNWSLKAEGLYWDLGRMNVQTVSYAVNPPGVDNNVIGWGRTSVNYSGVQAKVGVNYHFNFASAPIVAKF